MRPLSDDEAWIVEHEMRLVHWIISKRFRHKPNREDLEQAGKVGLCEAIRAYDPEVCAWSNFAQPYIINQIMEEIGRQRPFHIPRYHFIRVNGTDQYSLKRRETQRKNAPAVKRAIGAHQVRWRDCDAHAVLATSRDPIHDDRLDSIRDAIEVLNPREQVVMKRCAMAGETMKVVGRELGITKERVSQIRNAAIRKIKARLADEMTPVRRI